MTVYTKLRITALLTLALLGLVTAVGSAGSVSILVNIDDLTEGTPSLSLSGPSPLPTPTILASGSEFLHFRLPVDLSAAPTNIYSDFFEDVLGGTLSDRLLITTASEILSSTCSLRLIPLPLPCRVELSTSRTSSRMGPFSPPAVSSAAVRSVYTSSA